MLHRTQPPRPLPWGSLSLHGHHGRVGAERTVLGEGTWAASRKVKDPFGWLLSLGFGARQRSTHTCHPPSAPSLNLDVNSKYPQPSRQTHLRCRQESLSGRPETSRGCPCH